MWFWWFMLAFGLMVPAIQIIAGWMMWKHCPQSINNVYGYRTSRSKKNQDTWKFAHEYCGRLWWKMGLVVLVLSVLAYLPFYHSSEDAIATVGLITCTVQMVALLIPVFFTEAALKRTFHKDGTRREIHGTN